MSEITITMLGTTAGVPTRHRAHACIHLSFEDREKTNLLFDCGEGAQSRLLSAGLNLMKLDSVFLTHWHGDHCLGLPGLLDTMGFEGRTDPITVYAPEAERVRKAREFSYSMADFPVKSVNVDHEGRTPSVVRETDLYKVMSVPVKHSVPAVAYAFIVKEKTGIDVAKAVRAGLPAEGKIYGELADRGSVDISGRTVSLEEVAAIVPGKKVVYSGDTEICDELRELAGGADLLIQDCTYFEENGPERPHRHASLPEVMEMVSEAGIKRTLLTHISRKYRDINELHDMIKRRPDLMIAEDLMVVKI